MLDSFLNDLAVPDYIVQIGTKNRVLAVDEGKADTIKNIIRSNVREELFFLGGVDRQRRFERASDTDVRYKNYLYFDWDIRTLHPEITDQEIKNLANRFIETVKEPFLRDWRYIVYTGNGLHIYYFGNPTAIQSKSKWKFGMMSMGKKLCALIGEKLDPACINVSRLGRLPGSYNRKKGAEKLVEILKFQDRRIDISNIEKMGEELEREAAMENIRRIDEIKKQYPEKESVYKAIDAIPIAEIVTKLMGWRSDGKYFYGPMDDKPKACFVSADRNALIHGGTDHLDGRYIGYGPFEFVRAAKKIDNFQTFQWFRDEYEHIRNMPKTAAPLTSTMLRTTTPTDIVDVDDIFSELEQTNFEQLFLGGDCKELDAQKFIIRGAITRIGAFSNIGKSKLAYFFAHRLLKNGYKGIIFSTEVPRSIVLANMLIVETGESFWDILERRYVPTDKVKDTFRHLSIYDVVQTGNTMPKFEDFIRKHIEESKKPDFIMIDFVQGVTPSVRSDGEYAQMTGYALEVQSIAQKYNVSIIDLSQISNTGIRDEFASVGQIPYKGSGHLYSSADIGILLKRNKVENETLMTFEIRKHKYLPPKNLKLECDFKRGSFKVSNDEFETVSSIPMFKPSPYRN